MVCRIASKVRQKCDSAVRLGEVMPSRHAKNKLLYEAIISGPPPDNLMDVLQSLGRPIPLPADPPMSLRRASAEWWWTHSKRGFQLFMCNYYAKGYELLRRLLKSEIFFFQNPNTTWRQLPHAKRALFRMTYKRVLEQMGLVRRISFRRNVIYFDCRLPSNYLIQALAWEFRHPSPLAAGTNLRPVSPRPVVVEERWLEAYTKRLKWELAFPPESYQIRLPLPEPLPDGNHIRSCFKSFVKDKPPPDFKKHRRQFSPIKPARPPFNKPKTLALGLMILDYGDIQKLARWFVKNPEALELLGMEDKRTEIAKSLYNARQQLQRLHPIQNIRRS
jgi:hypothetical protein